MREQLKREIWEVFTKTYNAGDMPSSDKQYLMVERMADLVEQKLDPAFKAKLHSSGPSLQDMVTMSDGHRGRGRPKGSKNK